MLFSGTSFIATAFTPIVELPLWYRDDAIPRKNDFPASGTTHDIQADEVLVSYRSLSAAHGYRRPHSAGVCSPSDL